MPPDLPRKSGKMAFYGRQGVLKQFLSLYINLKMAFELKNTAPWARKLNEYKAMFCPNNAALNKRIFSFGGAPAIFNTEITKLNKKVVLNTTPVCMVSNFLQPLHL
jgi:hypothetical protein